MGAEPLSLDALLESVADGTSLDWAALEAAADESQRRLIRHLRVVAGVAEVHRTVPLDDAAPMPALVDIVGAGRAVPRWGHLILLEKIGEGAFGEVYRARDPWLDREVALKLLRPAVAGNVTDARIVDEARTLARVRHPNVVTVYGADMHDGRVGLWMELVRGRTLSQIVAAQGPFSASEAAIIGQEICRALAAVHAAGLVHRDVKAQNVMREAGGRLVLMDFGAGQTPLYLAPELLQGTEPTVAGDVYALGVLLYYLVTGRFPLKGASLEDLRAAHARGDRPHLAEARPELPDAFVRVVERALDADPSRRFATARQMQDALARVTTPGTSHGPAIVAPGRRPARGVLIAAAAVLVASLGAGLWIWQSRSEPPASNGSPTWLAVLPFRHIGPDAVTAYYGDGLSEDLTAQLARLPAVRLVSGVSVRRYRDTDRPAGEIGRELNVSALVTGSVRVVDDRVRIVVELVDTRKSEQLWAGTFDRSLDDVLAIQAEVAQQVAQALVGSLSPRDAARLDRARQDPRAFDLYLKGRYQSNTRTPEGLRQSIDLFRQAIAIDPDAALPYVGLADAFLLTAFYNLGSRAEAHREAEAAAAKAISLEPELGAAHAALGGLRLEQLRWAEAEQSLRRAIELNPSYASAHHWYALWLTQRGRFDEALASIDRARSVDPYSLVLSSAAGYILQAAARFDEALARYRAVLDVEPARFQTHIGIIETLVARGSVDEAMRALEDARRVTGRQDDLRLAGAYVYALARNVDQARTLLADVIADLPDKPASAAEIASIHGVLGDRGQAFEWLERAESERDTLLGYLAVDPRFDSLRDDARFGVLLERLGLAAKERGDR